MTELDCLTWNVHRCRGRGGVVDAGRTADVLLDLARARATDIAVLTEADAEQAPYHGLLDLDRIAGATGLTSAHYEADLRWSEGSHGFLGTIVLHSPRLSLRGGHLLDLPGRYPRGAVILTFTHAAGTLRVIATHLSLTQALRAVQMRAIGQYLDRHPALPTLLIGDLNEWRPWGGAAFAPRLVGHAFRGPARPSFPTRWPLLPLDRVLATRPARVVTAEAVASRAARLASDHLPVRARVKLG